MTAFLRADFFLALRQRSLYILYGFCVFVLFFGLLPTSLYREAHWVYGDILRLARLGLLVFSPVFCLLVYKPPGLQDMLAAGLYSRRTIYWGTYISAGLQTLLATVLLAMLSLFMVYVAGGGLAATGDVELVRDPSEPSLQLLQVWDFLNACWQTFWICMALNSILICFLFALRFRRIQACILFYLFIFFMPFIQLLILDMLPDFSKRIWGQLLYLNPLVYCDYFQDLRIKLDWRFWLMVLEHLLLWNGLGAYFYQHRRT